MGKTKTPVLKHSRQQRWHAGAPYDAGHQFLTAHGAALEGLRPIENREYVQRALDLANWDGEDTATFLRLEERLLVGGEWRVGASILQPRERDAHDRYSGQFYRDILIRELSPLLAAPPRLRPREADPDVRTPRDVPPLSRSHEHLARARHGQVAAIGVAWQDGDRTKFGYVPRPATLYAAIDTVLWMLTANEPPLASELRQCAWDGCFNFFLAAKPKKGGPRRKYCSTGCMDAMHVQNTPQRKAARKAGMTTHEYRNKQAKTNRRARSTR
jgi:hypothetical protein